MRVVKDREGNYVLFDGNGRFKSIAQAFNDKPDLLLEVEHFEIENPEAREEVFKSIEKIRKMRGLTIQK